MIRKMKAEDIERVMAIWFESNVEAHSFVERDYWVKNYPMVKSQISQAEVFVSEDSGNIQGFIGIADTYIAGIFVDKSFRSAGIGTNLLDYTKSIRDTLFLSVYEQNKRAVDFYLREGFYIAAEGTDDSTHQREYQMCWKRTV